MAPLIWRSVIICVGGIVVGLFAASSHYFTLEIFSDEFIYRYFSMGYFVF